MNKEQIFSEVANSKWQPQFEFTDDLKITVNNTLKGHEDYFLNLHGKVEEIIKREIDFAIEHKPKEFYSHNWDSLNNIANKDTEMHEHLNQSYQITFADVCNWQKELFEHKQFKIQQCVERANCIEEYELKPYQTSNRDALLRKIADLPNQHIELGLRQTNVKVDNWTPPEPIFLEELKELCFPIVLDVNNMVDKNTYSHRFSSDDDIYINQYKLKEWYKIFQTIHFFEDLNGRLGSIIINILSFILTGKYLIKK